MSYRDDRDADQARITALETDLAAARRKIDQLEGRGEQALVVASGTALDGRPAKAPWYGKLDLQLTRTFDGEFPRDQLETLVEGIRAMTNDHGRSELFRSSLTWSSTTNEQQIGPFLMITVVVKDGRTTLTANDRLKQLAGGLYGGLGAGVGITGIIPLLLAAPVLPVLMPALAVGWLGGIVFGARALFLRASRKRAQRLQRLVDAVAREIAAKIP